LGIGNSLELVPCRDRGLLRGEVDGVKKVDTRASTVFSIIVAIAESEEGMTRRRNREARKKIAGNVELSSYELTKIFGINTYPVSILDEEV